MAKRVRNEVALHKKMRHTNILTLYHFFEDDERVYLVMELCSHGELYSLLRRRRENGENGGTLTENEARIILRDIVAGLKFLHFRGIIHRDLKLSNILLSETGQAKIADFGLAVATEFSDSDSRERTICGTPNYLAPEILNKKNYGRGADIWSLGCLLYSFLTGRPPFDSPDLPQTFDKVKRLDYQIPDHLSPTARDLISRLLSGDPINRPTFDQIIWHPFFNPAVSDPLCTRRLNPMKQMTKYGCIEIFTNGSVSVDFLDASDILMISSDGLRIESFDKRNGQLNHMASSSIANLASPLKRRYEYARRFINLVKAKTPLILLNTTNFKAFLMENSCGLSSGDFYINYRDGIRRSEYCWVSRQLRLFDSPTMLTPSLTVNDPSSQILSEIASPLHREMLMEFLARYKQCLQIRDGILHVDGTERSKYRGTKFPFIIEESDHTTSNMLNNSNNSLSRMPVNINVSQLSVTSNYDKRSSNDMIKSFNTFPNVRKYLSGIGWCLSINNKNSEEDNFFLVLFNDGRSIQIDGHADTVLDLNSNRLLPINANLPDDIKEMLAMFSKFL